MYYCMSISLTSYSDNIITKALLPWFCDTNFKNIEREQRNSENDRFMNRDNFHMQGSKFTDIRRPDKKQILGYSTHIPLIFLHKSLVVCTC